MCGSTVTFPLCTEPIWHWIHTSSTSLAAQIHLLISKPERNELTACLLWMPSILCALWESSLCLSASFNSNTNGLKGHELISNSLAHVLIIIHSLPQVIIRIIKVKHDCFCHTNALPFHCKHTYTGLLQRPGATAFIKSSESRKKGYKCKKGGVGRWGERGPSALSQALGLLGHALLPSCRKTPCSQKECVCVCVTGGVLVRLCVHCCLWDVKAVLDPDAFGSISDSDKVGQQSLTTSFSLWEKQFKVTPVLRRAENNVQGKRIFICLVWCQKSTVSIVRYIVSLFRLMWILVSPSVHDIQFEM